MENNCCKLRVDCVMRCSSKVLKSSYGVAESIPDKMSLTSMAAGTCTAGCECRRWKSRISPEGTRLPGSGSKTSAVEWEQRQFPWGQ